MSTPPSKSNQQKKIQKPNQDPTTQSEGHSKNDVQKDADRLKKHYPLSLALRILFILFLFLAMVYAALLYFMGTDGGTQFLIEKISEETGLTIHYGSGNLRDGIWVTDLNIPAGDSVDIKVDKAYVKLGWRAIIKKEIHLRDADIQNLSIINNKPSSNKKFSYAPIQMPVNLHLDKVTIGKITFTQPDIYSQIFSDIQVDDLDWIDTKLEVKNGNLTYGFQSNNKTITQIGRVENLKGNIDFDKNYPINAKANVDIFSISNHHFDTIDLKAKGSLKNLHGKLKSNYNKHKITAEIDIQPMISDTPMKGVIKGKKVPIPYATDYNIELKQAVINLEGTWKKLKFNIDGNLNAKHIPSGHYHGSATYDTQKNNLKINKLLNKSKQGELTANAEMNWSNDYWLNLTVNSENYQLDHIVPKEWQDFRGYVPEKLNGSLELNYQHKNNQGKMEIDTRLQQKSAETFVAKIIREEEYNQENRPNPYRITAHWSNLYRKIKPELDVHNLKIIDSNQGKAELFVVGNRLTADIDAQINQLTTAPKGEYQVSLHSAGKKIEIENLAFNGEVGNLTGSANVTIPSGNEPTIWSLDGFTDGFYPSQYQSSIPIEKIVGNFSISDEMHFGSGKHTDAQYHKLTIHKTDIQTRLNTGTPRDIALNGNGKFDFTLDNTGLANFDARYDGMINDANLPKGQFNILAKGTPTDIQLNKIIYEGNSGLFNGRGKLLIKNNQNQESNSKLKNIGKHKTGEYISWELNANVSQLDLASLSPDAPIQLTGSINTAGTWFNPTEETSNQHTHHKTIDSNKNRKVQTSSNSSIDIAAVENDLKISSKAPSKEKPDGELTHIDFQFDGNIKTEKTESPIYGKIPSGKLSIDASGNLSDLTVKRIYHDGTAGFINAKGKLNLEKGYHWQLDAKMKNFNLGFFVPETASTISGNINTTGNWITDQHPKKKNTITTSSKEATTPPSSSVNEKINGKLRDFRIKFDGDIKTSKLPSGKLEINASSNKNQIINIHRLRHQGEIGSINGKGTLNLNNGYQWQLESDMQAFNLGYFLKDVPSKISGHVNTQGIWKEDSQSININDMDILGEIKGKPLNATGKLSAKLRLPKDLGMVNQRLKNEQVEQQYSLANNLIETLELQDVVAKWGENYITANGDKNTLQANVNIRNLDQLHKGLKGEVTGGISLKQKTNSENDHVKDNSTKQNIQKESDKDSSLPTLYVDLVAKNIALPFIALSDGHIQGKIVNMGKDKSQLTFTAKELNAGEQSFNQVKAIFVGTDEKHKLNLSISNNELNLIGNLSGSFTNNQWKGILSNSHIKSKHVALSQLQPTEMLLNFNQASLHLASHCWQANRKVSKKDKGKLCFTKNITLSKDNGHVDLMTQQVDTSLFAFLLPADIDWRATLNGTANINWKKGEKPTINASLYTDNGKIGMAEDDGSVSSGNNYNYLPYRRLSLIALSTKQGLKLRTDINSGGKIKGFADVTIDPYQPNKPIIGEISLNNFHLAIFKPFFPGIRRLEGFGSLNGKVSGTLSKPLVSGEFALKDADLAMLGLPVNLSKINATAKINGTNAIINGHFNSGDGEGKVSGTVDWKNILQAKIAVKGNELDISKPPLLSAKINPDVNVIIRPNDKYVEIKGAVSIPSATFRPPEANEEIISKSADVAVLDRRQTGDIDAVLAITEPWSINANVGIDLGSEVSFRGFGAELPLAGALVVTQKGQGEMRGKGVVQVSRRSNVDVFGQSLELEYAQVRFNGKIEQPNLSIEASKAIGGSTVGVRVKGDVAEPEITVFNNVGLTEQQAMNALVTGRLSNESANQVSEEGFRSEVTNNLAAAGLSVGLNPTRDFTNQIGRAVGLQSLSLGASGNSDDTVVNVTGYITPDLYIRYGFGVFNAQSQLSTRYQLTRRLYLEATSATEKFVDLVYSWQF